MDELLLDPSNANGRSQSRLESIREPRRIGRRNDSRKTPSVARKIQTFLKEHETPSDSRSPPQPNVLFPAIEGSRRGCDAEGEVAELGGASAFAVNAGGGGGGGDGGGGEVGVVESEEVEDEDGGGGEDDGFEERG